MTPNSSVWAQISLPAPWEVLSSSTCIPIPPLPVFGRAALQDSLPWDSWTSWFLFYPAMSPDSGGNEVVFGSSSWSIAPSNFSLSLSSKEFLPPSLGYILAVSFVFHQHRGLSLGCSQVFLGPYRESHFTQIHSNWQHRLDGAHGGDGWRECLSQSRVHLTAFTEEPWLGGTRASMCHTISHPVYAWKPPEVFLPSVNLIRNKWCHHILKCEARQQHFHSSSIFLNWQLIPQLFREKGSAWTSKRYSTMRNIFNNRKDRVNHLSEPWGCLVPGSLKSMLQLHYSLPTVTLGPYDANSSSYFPGWLFRCRKLTRTHKKPDFLIHKPAIADPKNNTF